MSTYPVTWGEGDGPPSTGGAALTIVYKTANQSFSSTGLFDVDDMILDLPASTTSIFRFFVPFTTAVSTTGIALGINGPVTPTFMNYGITIPTSQTGVFFGGSSAFGVGVTGSGSAGVTQPLPASVEGMIIMGTASGTVQLGAGSEVQGSAATIQEGAYGWVTQ